MNITVIIPTYCRPTDLARCLEGFKLQSRSADEILVVVRDTDTATWNFLQNYDPQFLPLKILTVKVTGVVAAMNLGLDVATGDIISFIDDDAVPHADWLSKIEAHFLADEQIAGVGGRDRIYQGKQLVEGQEAVVGKLCWFGRMIPYHHLGVGTAREVDILKGVNMSFRCQAIADMRFDTRMKGTGAQVHFEVGFCLSLKRANWKLIYDPQIVVDHHLGQRFDEDLREQVNPVAYFNSVHNQTLAILEHFSPQQRIIFALWAILVGTRGAFGLVQLLRFLPTEGTLALKKWLLSMQGRRQGWLTWQESNRLKPTPITLS
ncbi:MAG: glycosyltransferase family 2 protein [Waterburya sp.]